MNALCFERKAVLHGSRRVRNACFRQRSFLPVSAACVVANTIRERLGALLGTVRVRLLEPVVPDAAGWTALLAQGHLHRVRGALAQAAFVLRPADATALACGAFGVPCPQPRALSPMETQVVRRALDACTPALASVCGRDAGVVEGAEREAFATYFELIVEGAAQFRLGVALAAEPREAVGATLGLDDLADVEIELSVQVARGDIPARALLDLRPGVRLPMMTRVGDPGLLMLAGGVLARGACGTMAERHAMVVGTLH